MEQVRATEGTFNTLNVNEKRKFNVSITNDIDELNIGHGFKSILKVPDLRLVHNIGKKKQKQNKTKYHKKWFFDTQTDGAS